MSTKLTLTMDKRIIEQAKIYATNNGESLSELVENYFKYLTENTKMDTLSTLSPKVKKLKGILKVDKDFNYKTILLEELTKKYNG